MNKQIKQSIQKAFEIQEPDQQEMTQFLKTLPQPRISMWQFVLIQTTYLRKWTVFFSILLLFPALLCAYHMEKNTLWIVSSFIPFLGLLAVTENARSIVYGMIEFEMTTRFSLRSVILARMGVLGVLDMFVLCCLTPLCCINNPFSLLQIGIYLLVPYVLTVNISLWITRRFHSKEAIYGCMSVAVLVSGINTGLHFIADFIYQLFYIKWWFVLCAFLVVEMIYEIYYTIKQTEEVAWNL